MDPTQFGVVMLLNCALGLNTPPVGSTQFVGCAIGGVVGPGDALDCALHGALLVTLLAVTCIADALAGLAGLGGRLKHGGRF